ncbi:T-cell surface protein tactile isoform X2 [Mugil cephalus]|uniref:T-cell surface protein tactile isoform X2 n=1 Tax=Mugil cephalus TaxID=48193 RepID=UPI001FB81710|nr:T-cell surface protein tactile isoform X2 [Mugil cephalus]
MAGNVLGTTFFLLLASVIQGFLDTKFSNYETMEAEEGQNVTLPCSLGTGTDIKIVSIDWSKKENGKTQLVVWALGHGAHLFWPNVSIQLQKTETDMVIGSYLHIPDVKKQDSGMYTCDIKQFPSGSIIVATQLIIKDESKIKCDVNGTVEVRSGDNVSVRCRASPNAQYRWTKGEEVVSENASLELQRVTDAHAGVYTLTVNTGNEYLHKEFIIMVLTTTTSLRTDLMTASPQGTTESVNSSRSTSQTTKLPTLTDRTKNHRDDRQNTSEVTTSSATQPDTYHILKSTASSFPSTRPTKQMTIYEMRNESKRNTPRPSGIFSTMPSRSSTVKNSPEIPDASPTQTIEVTIVDMEDKGEAIRSHVLLLLTIIPMIVLILILGILYRRQLIKKRMDEPPPFKPPPPPVKYTAARQTDVSTLSFPTSRCNSIAYA